MKHHLGHSSTGRSSHSRELNLDDPTGYAYAAIPMMLLKSTQAMFLARDLARIADEGTYVVQVGMNGRGGCDTDETDSRYLCF